MANVECFRGADELVCLKLEGNMVKGLEGLKALQSCDRLRNLHMETLTGEGQNPICQLEGYRDNLLSFLKQITRLDSVPRGMKISNGSELKTDKRKDLKI